MKTLPTPIKGNADWREYKAVELENGVTCLFVHDKESKTTAMSCCVNVGASADPRSMSGLAHFCEHMCFLGSEKYPGENDYKRYLSSHGGRSNASTSMHLTNYKFEVIAEHAEKAVDLFSNFFVAPLFTPSGTGREVQAVNSENSKNRTADSRRRLQILKDLADPSHYYSKFSTGNADTLPTQKEKDVDRIREALMVFHKKHYRPENMVVVIAGPQSLNELQEWVVSRYSKIESRSETPEVGSELSDIEKLVEEASKEAPLNSASSPSPPYSPPFDPSHQGGKWPVLLTTKPLRSTRKLVMMFPMPSDRRNPDRAPSSVLSHLLGHEGEGSPFAVLQNLGLLSSLSAGARTKAPDFMLFQIDMGLSEKGEERWTEVVDVIFSYCRLLNNELNREKLGKSKEFSRIWGEMSQLDKIFFHQTSPRGVYSYAPILGEQVTTFGSEHCLSAGSMLREDETTFPLEAVTSTAALLRPGNCILERCSDVAWDEARSNSQDQIHFGKKTEPWYSVDYYVEGVLDKWTTKDKVLKRPSTLAPLKLPLPNGYLPRTLDLAKELPPEAKTGPRIDKAIDPPVLICNTKMGRMFHRLDDRYALPQSSLKLLIRNAAVQHSKEDGEWKYNADFALKASMLSGIFSEAMAQETYAADLAGLYWSLSLGPSGVKMSFFGFSDRLPDLALKIQEAFLAGDFLQQSYFESSKDRVIRGLKTYFESRRADSYAVYYRDALLASKDNGIEESLVLAKQVTFDSLLTHHQRITDSPEAILEGLFSGNVTDKEAIEFFESSSRGLTSRMAKSASIVDKETMFIPVGLVERRVKEGQDIELHFSSKNPEEENGAVVMTFQSSLPSFKGDVLSDPAALESTACIRLLSHMLREPLFDELRTKQQLGYIVNATAELGFDSKAHQDGCGPSVSPVDFLTITVLSRKMPPPAIVTRIDEFLDVFRESLRTMPDSVIDNHASALSTKLLKPIQKLQAESNSHFGSIQRYSPEVHFQKRSSEQKTSATLPWDSNKSLAVKLQSLNKEKLLQTWDRMIAPATRARVVSCVYGNTFSLQRKTTSHLSLTGSRSIVVDSFPQLLSLRTRLAAFQIKPSEQSRWNIPMMRSQPGILVGIGCIVGAGVVGAMAMSKERRKRN